MARDFRAATGATTFGRIGGYNSAVREHGMPVLTALCKVFAGAPLQLTE